MEVDVEAVEMCMICKHGLVDAQDIHEARTAFSKTLLAVKLGKIIQAPFKKEDENATYRICISCMDLVNEIDQCEIKLMALENEIKLKFKMPFPIEVHSRHGLEQQQQEKQQRKQQLQVPSQKPKPLSQKQQNPHSTGQDQTDGAEQEEGDRDNDQDDDGASPQREAEDADILHGDDDLDDANAGQEEEVVAEAPATLQIGAATLAPEQICQVLDAAGISAGESYSIEVVDTAGELDKGGHVTFGEDLAENIILYEQPDGDYTTQQLVLEGDGSYRMHLSDGRKVTLERPVRKKLKRRRWGTEGGYFCDECDSTFVHFRDLAEHRNTAHDAIETFRCRYCKQVARTKIKLHRHMQEHHKERMLPCPHCEKRFPEKCNLTRHIAIHLEPKFACEICSRAFHSKGDLGKHMVFRHTTERNFRCPECDGCFKTSWMMKRHLSRVHARL